ncbi:poly(ADP-ribose) glycohydrolase isoform X2 [Thalassophryne amazonica]|uniref:poly(ADP-ribose) glycohydrolase isoform X2 n=1 Tax=Thalassophryne amazonica TaxID=390379 RepID=UPI0014720E31|nr:poly(ADP-ribose) glycohydrolase isoform X2 [Thalassophryne amazonica]
MAKWNVHRNDSSQIKAIMQQNSHSDSAGVEKNQQHGERDVTEASGESSSSSTAGAVLKRREEKTSEPVEALAEESTSSYCSMSSLKRLPQCHVKLQRLSYSRTHIVLIDVSVFNSRGALMPQKGRDMWHKNFVKMPCSSENITMVNTGFMKKSTKVRRWDLISGHLGALAKKAEVTADEVAQAVLRYNPKYSGQWSFDALYMFVKRVPDVENDFSALFPKMAALALMLPDYVMKAIPLLQAGQTASITLSQVQISCLLANAFFCTFPHRNTSSPNAEYHNYPTINFNSLFGNWSERKKEKLRAIMHYFRVVTDEATKPRGLVTFERRFLRDTDRPNWRSCKEEMPKLHVTSSGTIETKGTGMLQVDFACNLIGGGVLSSGLVQEEILFLMNPELIVSRLFTEKLEDTECLLVTGSQQFSCYAGFGDSFEWTGPHQDRLQRDAWARLQRQILAIDALHFKQRRDQYNMAMITRELNKAYCGFKKDGPDEPDVATGQWGCGVFKGDPQLKDETLPRVGLQL